MFIQDFERLGQTLVSLMQFNSRLALLKISMRKGKAQTNTYAGSQARYKACGRGGREEILSYSHPTEVTSVEWLHKCLHAMPESRTGKDRGSMQQPSRSSAHASFPPAF